MDPADPLSSAYNLWLLATPLVSPQPWREIDAYGCQKKMYSTPFAFVAPINNDQIDLLSAHFPLFHTNFSRISSPWFLVHISIPTFLRPAFFSATLSHLVACRFCAAFSTPTFSTDICEYDVHSSWYMVITMVIFSRSSSWITTDNQCAALRRYAIFKARFRYKGKLFLC